MKPKFPSLTWNQATPYIIAVFLVGGGILDGFTPKGFTDWVLYILPVLFAMRRASKRTLIITAICASLLTVWGFLVSPLGAPLWVAAISRFLGLVLIWAIVIIALKWRQGEVELARLRKAVEGSGEVVFMTDTKGLFTYVNPAFTRLYGYTAEEVVGKLTPRVLKSGQVPPLVYEGLWQSLIQKHSVNLEIVNQAKDGKLLTMETSASPVFDEKEDSTGFLSIQHDISERKWAEEEIVRANRVYAVISQINQLIVRTRDRDKLLAEACRISVEYGKFRMAWIGMADASGQSVQPVAWAGVEDAALTTRKISLTDSAPGLDPVVLTIREGKYSYCKDISIDPAMAPWREEALQFGCRSSITFPITVKEKPVGTFSIYATEPSFFNQAERGLLQEVTADISFALEMFELERQRKRMEEALRESENRLKTIIQEEPECVKIIDAKGCLEEMNPAGLAMMEADSFGQVQGQSICSFVLPEYRERFLKLAKGACEGKDGKLEFEMEGLKGTRRWMETWAVPLKDQTSGVVRCLGLTRDITERKRAEEEQRKLASLVESSKEFIGLASLDGNVIYVNPAGRSLVGLDAPPEETKIHLSDFVLEGDRPQLENEILPGIFQQGYWEGEFRLRNFKTGKPLLVRHYIFLIRNSATGEPTFLATVSHDISEHRQLEEQFRQAQKMEAVGQLAGGVAHDFNNLLTVINGYSEMMLGGLKPDDKEYKFAAEIKSAGERAAGLTRQLLAFSRQQVLAPQVLDLNTVIKGLHSMLCRLIGEDVELTTIPAKGLGQVQADPGQIEQILLNLAVNARDAMPGGGKLTIESANVDLDETYSREHANVKPGPHVMLAVSDTGAGMDAGTQKRIFEPFFTTKEKGKGTGLGLSTVYGIVKQSGGHIWVYSELGRGTTLKIYLPRLDAPIEALTPAVDGKEKSRGAETVLLVEDDTSIRNLVSETMGSKGYQVLKAADGEVALKVAQEHPGVIHLLLTDLVMPGISGRVLAERMAALYPQMKVLFMSGYTDDAVVRTGGLGSEMAFLQKPFTPDGLARKVRQVLDAP